MNVIFFTLGICLVGLGIFLVFPALLEMTEPTQDWGVFAVISFLCVFFGIGMMILNQRSRYNITVRQIYLMTSILWVVLPIVSGLPFYFTSTDYALSFTDSVFEGVSGMTTTGASVYAKLDVAPRGILLWRSMTIGIGGMGIIVLTMMILPFLRVGGMQLFQTESSDRTEKVMARTHHIAALTTITYLALCFLCALAYYWGGMSWFDAINHAMCTLATGGFSTHDLSFGYFNSALIQWIGVLFMMLGATPMLLYYTVLTRHAANRALLYQAKAYWLGMGLAVFAVAVYNCFNEDMAFSTALTLSAFNIVSIGTTTGFASTDYNLWGPFALMVFYFITVTGGCSGSTSGGVKVFRLLVMTKMMLFNVKSMIKPHGVFSVRMGGMVIREDIMRAVSIFFLLYVFVFVVITLGLAATGLDLLTSTTATATTLSGAGPGLGPIIGPVGNYSTLTDVGKWLLVAAMILGRLEIMTVLVLLTKTFWQDFRSAPLVAQG